jgi:transposase-like protein
MTTPPASSYAAYRFPAEVISYAVYLYFRFPLSFRMVEEMLAVRGIEVSQEIANGSVESLGESAIGSSPKLIPNPNKGFSRD